MPVQKPLQWQVQRNDNSIIVTLSGELTRNTLLPLWEQRDCFLSPKAHQHIYWELAKVDRLDSAGFMLLIELLNHYQKQYSNSLLNPPASVMTLAELFNLQAWLNPFLIVYK